MSAEALPIAAPRFAKALSDLSISSLYAKAAELRNSIQHLEKSNRELEEYIARDQDRELYEAIVENRDVIARMEERILLVRKEVTEIRCLPWEPEGASEKVEERESGGEGSAIVGNIGGGGESENTTTRDRRNGASGTDEEEGVFL